MTQICYTTKDVRFSYGKRPVIKGISQEIRQGFFYGILGPNGCGKTTFLDLMVAHKAPQSGTITFMGQPMGSFSKPGLARHIALVSQNFYINFPFTVADVVMMGRYPHMPRFSSPTENDFQIVDDVMEMTQVDRLKNHLITELSGGERQRTVFARALAQDADILLLDEATSNLDISHTICLLDIVRKKVKDNQLTVVSVFQDINLAAMYCDEIIFMDQGQVVQTGPTDKMMDAELIAEVFHVQAEIRFEPLYARKQAVFRIGGHR